MKVSCAIEICNNQLPSLCSGPKRKPSHSVLSIGYDPGKPNLVQHLALLICTTTNKAGTKYKLYQNIENIFVKFVGDGKATIKLRSPPHYLLISKADPVCLKSFLKVLHNSVRGGSAAITTTTTTTTPPSTTLSKLRPAATSQLRVPKTVLKVVGADQYRQVCSSGGFTRTVHTLTITNCNLTEAELLRLLRLTCLRNLDLANNQLCRFPAEFGRLALERLALNDNLLEELPAQLFTATALRTSLGVLDVSRNSLSDIPANVCELSRLNTLRLDANRVKRLPARLGGLRRLTTLTASHNQLLYLPASIRRLRLATVDVSDNPFPPADEQEKSADSSANCPASLLELSSRSVISNRLSFGEEDLPFRLRMMIADHQLCVCGRPFVNSTYRFLGQLDLKTIASTVVRNADSTTVPTEGWLCCARCS